MFLTKAQDEIVKAYFNPTLNKSHQGFDQNERRQIDFSMVVRTYETTSSSDFSTAAFDDHSNSKSVDLSNQRILMFLNESITVTRSNTSTNLTVVPITYQEYSRLNSKPFRRPLKNQAWRLLLSSDATNKADLIVKYRRSVLGMLWTYPC